MTAEDIIRLTEKPDFLNQDTLYELKNLVEEYPYFQTARLLYVLNLKKIKDLSYAPELRKLAFYAGDRKKVFYLAEADQFIPLKINELEKPEEIISAIDSFSLIDSFLSEKREEPSAPDKNNKAGAGKKTVQKESLVSSDYLSILLTEEADDKQQGNISTPMPYQDVIDRFLENDKKALVKIVLEKQENDFQEDFPAEQDTAMESSFFSETLAKIYLKQKKYEKALEIIRKLNLLYPEKNIYFADQIRFLEKLVINTKKQ